MSRYRCFSCDKNFWEFNELGVHMDWGGGRGYNTHIFHDGNVLMKSHRCLLDHLFQSILSTNISLESHLKGRFELDQKLQQVLDYELKEELSQGQLLTFAKVMQSLIADFKLLYKSDTNCFSTINKDLENLKDKLWESLKFTSLITTHYDYQSDRQSDLQFDRQSDRQSDHHSDEESMVTLVKTEQRDHDREGDDDQDQEDTSLKLKPIIKTPIKMNNSISGLKKSILCSLTKESKSQVCIKCGEAFSTSDLLDLHLNDYHNSSMKGDDDDDDLDPESGFKRPSKRKRKKKCIQDQRLDCEQCGKVFTSSLAVKRHIKRSHSSERYYCDQCAKVFTSKAGLDFHHIAAHTNSHFKCEMEGCDVVVKYRASLKQHYKNCHSHEKSHVCEFCGLGFNHGPKMRQHVDAVHLKKHFKCNLCEATLSNKSGLDLHIKTVHDKIRDHVCKICNKSWFKTYDLNQHYKKAHNVKIERYKNGRFKQYVQQ